MTVDKLIFFILSLSACLMLTSAARLPSEGIVEGDDAKSNDFPYQATLFSGNIPGCGAVIIGDHHILTAGHCVLNNDGSFFGKPLSVVVGIYDLKKKQTEGIEIPVGKIYVPNEYQKPDPMMPGDIAILMLSESLNLSENPKLKAVKLPKDEKETYLNNEAKIAGFGFDQMEVLKNPKTNKYEEYGWANNFNLKYAVADVLDTADCQNIYSFRLTIRDSNLCARTKQRNVKKPSGICTGDSGGPLVVDGETVIGVASASPFGCNESKYPGVYTRVSSYLEFIRNATENKSSFMRYYTY